MRAICEREKDERRKRLRLLVDGESWCGRMSGCCNCMIRLWGGGGYDSFTLLRLCKQVWCQRGLTVMWPQYPVCLWKTKVCVHFYDSWCNHFLYILYMTLLHKVHLYLQNRVGKLVNWVIKTISCSVAACKHTCWSVWMVLIRLVYVTAHYLFPADSLSVSCCQSNTELDQMKRLLIHNTQNG